MKKKSIIKFGLGGVALIVIVFLLVQVLSKIQRKDKIEQQLSDLPNVELKDLDGQSINLKDISYAEALAIFYINTECGICHDQMNEIKQIINDENLPQIVFVSGEDLEVIKNYKENDTIFNHPKIQLVHDYTEHFVIEYDIRSTPHILIYDKAGNLIINQKGFLRADKLLEVFNE
ncbi:MAG: redoxin domain-containing protein [Bacteroidetes bacterium]|jgi:thioredoxin-related protein|nr:redoxin domain-containing protein [Bacteroidota bacterium]